MFRSFRFAGRRLVLGCAALATAFSPAFAQGNLQPAGRPTTVAEPCSFDVQTLAVDGGVVAVWNQQTEAGFGTWARSGPSLEELGAATLLVEGGGRFPAAAAVPGDGFVVSWLDIDKPTPDGFEVVYRRFGADLAPLGAAVSVDQNARTPPALHADPDGSITVAYRGTGNVRLRRFSAADAPLTAPVVVDTVNPLDGTLQMVRIASNGAGFLVGWIDRGNGNVILRVRAVGLDGAPLGPRQLVASLPFFDYDDFDLASTGEGYFAAYSGGDNGIRGRTLAAEGGSPGTEVHLMTLARTGFIQLGGEGSSLVVAAFDFDSKSIVGAELEAPDFDGPLTALVPPEPWFGTGSFRRLTGIEPGPAGYILSWQVGWESVILQDPCDLGISVEAQVFGPPAPIPLVDVPAAGPAGLFGLAILTVAAALLLLRRI
jgi:hypothetical protein